ncbi:MAG TPA: hypothetical protein VIP53_08130 [Nitrososphaera sp.]
MVDQSIIQKIKEATVAVGVRNNDEDNPIKIIGSGSIINTRGYLLTASHVAKACDAERKKEVDKRNRKVRSAMYRRHPSGYEITDIEQFSYFEWDPKASERTIITKRKNREHKHKHKDNVVKALAI